MSTYKPEWDAPEVSFDSKLDALDWQIENHIRNPVRFFETLESLSTTETSQELLDYKAWNRDRRELRHFTLDEASYYSGYNKDKIKKFVRDTNFGTRQANNHLVLSLEELNNLISGLNDADNVPFQNRLGVKNGKNRKPIIIPFVMFKGGVAKTTNAVNASVYLALLGLKVLIIDFDSQASTSNFWGIRSSYDVEDVDNNTIFRVLTENPSAKAWKDLKPLDTHWPNIKILPSHAKISLVEVTAKENMEKSGYEFNDLYNLKAALDDGAFNDFDVVIVDTPPQFNRATVGITWASELLAIPNYPSALTAHTQDLLWGYLKKTYSEALRVDATNPPLVKKLCVIPNIVNTQMTYGVSEDIDRLVRTHSGRNVSLIDREKIIKRLLVVTDAAATYKTVFEATPKDGFTSSSLRRARSMFKDVFDSTLIPCLQQIWNAQDLD